MKIAIITRANLFSSRGGDTVQIMETSRQLRCAGLLVDILPASEQIPYHQYDLLHFFNLTRPADILHHIRKTEKPFVVSPILVDYSAFDKHWRKGVAGLLFKKLSPHTIEFIKTCARWFTGGERPVDFYYLSTGQKRSIEYILRKARLILPNSGLESHCLSLLYPHKLPVRIVYNGIDPFLFHYRREIPKDPQLILCVARLEGIKNQINLIRALNNTRFQLILIGQAAPNQPSYSDECRRLAAKNVRFIHHLPQQELVQYYQRAAVHVLPSWFETCGLSSLEAGAMGCNLVITDKGYTREYFGDDAFYCDPASPASILHAVELAAKASSNQNLQWKIQHQFTWQQAAQQTLEAYHQIVDQL